VAAPDVFFDDLLDRLRRGETGAETDLFRLYAGRLIALARRRLDKRTRTKVDAEDVVQSVFRSFFRRHTAGTLAVGDADGLWNLLATITACKCSDRVRFFRRQRRNVQQEAGAEPLPDAAGAEPTPQEAALLTETLERLMGSLNLRERDILTMHLQGLGKPEIAREVQRSERTVEVALHKVEQILTRWRQDESASAT
jgi:RNA polymerase sigma-70 factor (ECF subfamily)